ncbi:F-box/LRR-repeat protein At5g02910-like [Silene latifolia]|uniref:F-box/LRR-repeat protein At5g02910-like n=1 Tax=Silene latifolia TaxID=37657 RepID=UPI003D779696
MKLGNGVESRRNKRRLDKISNLPDELLFLIMSFLPTWYAVRTSILSRRWRYLFTLTDCLSFDDAPCFRGAITTVDTARTRSNGFFEIEAPNLAYLTYDSIAGVKIVPLWKYSCSLVEAKLHFDCHADDDRSLEEHREILRATAFKTTELHLRPNSVECLFMIGNMEQVPDFPSLTRLHLSYFSYDSWKNVKSVLDKSPQLETVVFTADLHDCDRRSSAPPPSESLLPFSCHAKVIDEVNHLCGHDRSSLLLLGHFLKNARVMKKLIVRKCHGFDNNGVTTS